MARLSSILDGVPSEIRILRNRGGTIGEIHRLAHPAQSRVPPQNARPSATAAIRRIADQILAAGPIRLRIEDCKTNAEYANSNRNSDATPLKQSCRAYQLPAPRPKRHPA